MSVGEMEAYSRNGFREMLKYAWDNTEFYPEFYGEHGIERGDLDTIEPEALPLIEKNIVRDNFFKIQTGVKGEEVHTSGTTGKPCTFLYSQDMITAVESNFVRLVNRGGDNFVGWGDLPIKSLYAASVGQGYASSLLLLSGLKKYFAKSRIVKAGEPLSTWTATIGNFKPNFISGYASCVNLLLGLQQAGRIDLHPKKIIIGGEPVTPKLMNDLKEAFGADVINLYGCTESLMVGAGATWYEGMYLFDDMNYLEVDDENRLILTPIINKTFPLIRYRMNDIMVGFRPANKDDVFPFSHIDKIAGRAEDVLWFVNGHGEKDFLHPLQLDDLDCDGMLKYQFVKIDDTTMEVDCVLENGVSDDRKPEIEKSVKQQVDGMLKGKKLDNIHYTVKFVHELYRNPVSGKEPLTVSHK